jgi:valyl-tRNA synthetase
MNSNTLDKGYEPKEVEEKWYDFWVKKGLFDAPETPSDKNFSIVIPPPNVTGVLHMGHALNLTMQDILCRYKKMRGYDVLWVPGTDHAGIATQNVVERNLASQGKKREDLGREKFIEAVWEWREKYGGAIINQMKRIGASCDWKRERFTMDAGLSRSVKEVFVRLYNEGLIYKGNYIINWCPRCNTALSDLEVDHKDISGKLYYIRYPFENNEDYLTIATTRPETMLGDTAVAVNPEDTRYIKFDLDGALVELPLTNRKIPVIKDGYVDISFGTGALKVTPAHDVNDFEIAGRHGLESIKVVSNTGMMTDEAGEFAGLDRFECRKQVVKSLKEKGLLIKIEDYPHSVGHCYRCGTVIEPSFSDQWFVKTKPLAEKAYDAVKTGKTNIIPENWKKTYFDWLDNIRDWCISRQIWWGHRIPAWNCEDCGAVTVALDDPKKCKECGSEKLIQESDVLDTWFSSALWPFSTMGWPEDNALIKKYYPTSVLVTGFDILFFWVARMMMMGIHFTGKVPFYDVYVHALVRDEDGQKMSKSKGNVIDPINMIEAYGADAFRFTLAAFAAQGRDIKMSEKRIEGYRHFINKLWNAVRFSLMHIDETIDENLDNIAESSVFDRWILSRLYNVSQETANALNEYRFNDAASVLYKFVWHELCDWYLEVIKPSLFDKNGEKAKNTAKASLFKVLKDTIRLLHPFIPFITEEIWHKLPKTEGSIMQAVCPCDIEDNKRFLDKDAQETVEIIMNVINGVRNVRGEMDILPSALLEVTLHSIDDNVLSYVSDNKDIIKNIAKLKSFEIEKPNKEPYKKSDRKPESSASFIAENFSVYVSLKGVINFEKERERLGKELLKVSKELEKLNKKLANADFLAKAPEYVVERVNEQKEALDKKAEKLKNQIDTIVKAGN